MLAELEVEQVRCVSFNSGQEINAHEFMLQWLDVADLQYEIAAEHGYELADFMPFGKRQTFLVNLLLRLDGYFN